MRERTVSEVVQKRRRQRVPARFIVEPLIFGDGVLDSGDAIDTAILRAQTQAQAGGELVRTFPFAEDRRRETNIWRRSEGTLAAMTKGAPETILAMCTLSNAERETWRAQVAALAAEAHKVIACAVHELPANERNVMDLLVKLSV